MSQTPFFLPADVWAARREAMALRLGGGNLRRGLFLLTVDELRAHQVAARHQPQGQGAAGAAARHSEGAGSGADGAGAQRDDAAATAAPSGRTRRRREARRRQRERVAADAMATMAMDKNATATIAAGEAATASETAEEQRPAGPLSTTPALVAPTPPDVAPPARMGERMDTTVVEPLAQLALAASKRPAESTPKSSPSTDGRANAPPALRRAGPSLGPSIAERDAASGGQIVQPEPPASGQLVRMPNGVRCWMPGKPRE